MRIQTLIRPLVYVKNLLVRIVLKLGVFFFRDIPGAFKSFENHDGELSTCAMAFFLLISFIPVSLVIISVLSFFYQSGDLAANVYMLQLKNQFLLI